MTQEDLIALAEAFRDATAEDLSGAAAPADFHRAARRAQQRLDQLFASMMEDEDRLPVACSAGCSWCCHLKVETRAHDIFALAAWVRENFAPDALEALLGRLRAHAGRLAGLSVEQQLRINNPCPLLGPDGRCTAYAGRPATCRIVHSADVKPCIYAYEHPEELDAPSGWDMDLRLGQRVANDGVAFAFHEAGYDTQLYHLSAGLLEALTDPDTHTRWMARQPAFSPPALSRPEQNPSSEGQDASEQVEAPDRD